MHLDNSFISTTLCDDLARATDAGRKKKIRIRHANTVEETVKQRQVSFVLCQRQETAEAPVLLEKQHKPKPKAHKRPRENGTDQDSSIGAGNLCANELRDLAHQQKNTTKEHHQTSRQDLAKVSTTIHTAAPKPRIPPARIPEIALRSPPGMRHLRNKKQSMEVYGYTRCVVTMFGLECMLHWTLEFSSK